MKLCLRLAVFALALTPATAQVHERWSGTYDGAFPATLRDAGGPLAVLPDGSSYQLGTCQEYRSAPNGVRYHVALVKRDAGGILQWNRFEPTGGFTRTRPVEILAAANGDALVVASTESASGPSSYRRMLYRYDSAGALAWSRVDGVELTTPTDLLAAANGDVWVAGSDESRFAVERFDAGGNSLWKYLWPLSPGSFIDTSCGLAALANGDVVAAGTILQSSDRRPAIARIAPDGTERWTRTLPQSAGYGSVAADAAGNAYALQHYATPPVVDAFDAAGTQLWSRPLPGLEALGDPANALIRVDALGRILVAGRTVAAGSAGDLALRVLDGNGSIVLEREVHFGSPSRPRGIELSSAGEIVISALVGASASNWSPALAAFDLAGNTRWVWNSGVRTDTDGVVDLAPAPEDAWLVSSTRAAPSGSDDDIRIVRVDRTARPVCGGDGVPPTCPCGNASQPIEQAGCTNGQGHGGRLVDGGASELAADTLELVGSGMTDGAALYFQGSTYAPTAFGDGTRCASGATRRLGTRVNVNGSSTFPGLGGTAISTAGAVSSPGERIYQVWYRDTSTFCTSATFNVTNALVVRWY